MNKILLPLTAVALCFTAQQAMAASISGTGNATAKIIAPLTIAAGGTGYSSGNLNFGTMLSSSAHTVTVGTTDNRTGSNNAMLVSDSNTPKSGLFTVTNTETNPVNGTISVDSSTTISNGTTTLNVTGLNASPTGSTSFENGDTEIKVGGQLAVSQNATAGDYTGTYHVTINY